METRISKLQVTISKTADGARDYLQVVSADQFTVNVVLIADVIAIVDARAKPTKKPVAKRGLSRGEPPKIEGK